MLSGARAVRVIERPESRIGEHAHDWPVLSLYVMGSCTRSFESEAAEIDGPCAVLHPPGEFHWSSVGAVGFEQIDIEFDPIWLGLAGPRLLGRVQHWRGGSIGAAARRLSAMWAGGPTTEGALRRATAGFIHQSSVSEPPREPRWLGTLRAKLACEEVPTTLELARALDLHPAWLTQGYRAATGEGLRETLTRRRVEHAVLLLRTSSDSAAAIAAEAGFCDQSHMIRCFRQLLGRTPGEVRGEAVAIANGSSASS